MTLLHPFLLAAGLAAIAIPIAIHFFMRRRRQPIAWGAMRFLLEAYRQQRRRLEFEKWLLLAVRCLVLALLALGLARPLIGGALAGAGDTPRELYILLDNSLAASALDDDGNPALDRHRAAAKAALAELNPGRGDRAALITLAGPADPVVTPPSAEPGAIADLIDALEPTDAAPDLAGALARVAELTAERSDTDRVVLLLTDWRAPALDAADDLPALDPSVRVVSSPPADFPRDNQQIVSVRPLRAVVLANSAGSGDAAASAQQVRVELRRLGPSLPAADATLALRLDRVRPDGTPEPAGATARPAPQTETPVAWDAGQTEATIVVPLPAIDDPTPGLGVLTAELRTDPGLDAIDGDNTVRRVVDVRRGLRIGLIARARYGQRVGVGSFTPADWLAAALAPELDPASGSVSGSAAGRAGPIEPVPVEPTAVDAPRLAGLDAAFVLEPSALDRRAWDNLADFARRGGMVAITPDADPAAAAWAPAAVDALDLPVAFDAEPREHGPPLTVDAPRDRALGPLTLLAAELTELTGPVRVFRTLGLRPAEPGDTDAFDTPLDLSGGEPLVAVTRPRPTAATAADAPGLVAILTAAIDPDWTDLPARPLFVPLIHELVRQGVGEARGASAVPAGARLAAGPGAAEFAAIAPATGATPARLRVDPAGLSDRPVRTAGAFAVLDAEGAMRTVTIVNPDTRAGRTAPTPAATVAERLAQASADPVFIDPGDGPPDQRVARALRGQGEQGAPVAWIALLAALALALFEIALARRASHAEAEPAASPARAAPRTASSSPTGAAA